MNSSIYHRIEKWFYRFFFLLLFFLIATIILYFVYKESIIYDFVSLTMKILLVISAFIYLYMVNKSKGWRRRGNEITKEIGLQRLIILEGYLPERSKSKVLEVHLNSGTVQDGFKRRKNKREKEISLLKEELKNDFKRLYMWKKQQNTEILLITTTHTAVAKIWEKSSYPYFYMKKMDKMIDPYVQMNLIEWMLASFSLTGKVNCHPPKQWDSYFFYLTGKEGIEK